MSRWMESVASVQIETVPRNEILIWIFASFYVLQLKQILMGNQYFRSVQTSIQQIMNIFMYFTSTVKHKIEDLKS